MNRPALSVVVALCLALAVPSAALAKDGGRDEVRSAGACGRGADSKLKLKADDGRIEVEFEVEHARRSSSWRVVVVQEGRVAWRGRARTSTRGAFEVKRRLRDLGGADRVTVRGVGPRGVTCVASATLSG